jgi:hypothetical protein
MFIREQLQVPTPAVVVRGWIADGSQGSDRIAVAAQASLAGGPGGSPGEPSQHRPDVTVQARTFNREQTTVVALRVFTASSPQVIQPTLDVDLEIQPVEADATALVLTGVIRPTHPPTTDPAITSDSDDLRSTALRFLTELANLVLSHATAQPGIAPVRWTPCQQLFGG